MTLRRVGGLMTTYDDATLIRAWRAGAYADAGTTLPAVSPADRWIDHLTGAIGPRQRAWAARARANRAEAMRRVLAGDPREPRVIAGEVVGRADWIAGSREG